MAPSDSFSSQHRARALSKESERGTLGESQPASPEREPGYVDSWLQRSTQLAASAREVDTPEAWQSFATAVEVLLEIGQTLGMVAEAREHARRLAMAADTAERESRRAVSEAASARQTAEQLARAAQGAITEAADARQAAEQWAQALGQATRRAETAVREANDAMHRAEHLSDTAGEARQRAEGMTGEATEAEMNARQMEEFIAQVGKIDSAVVWREAHRRLSTTRSTGDATALREQGSASDPQGPLADEQPETRRSEQEEA